jgi:hypothetical protein
MSVSGITSSSVAATYTPLPVQQQAPAPKNAPAKDTVTISKQALQLANDGDPAALEAQETSTEKTSEKIKGKA